MTLRPGSSSRLPLFCVHAEAGDVSLYRNLAAHLDEQQTVLGLPAPPPGELPPQGGLESLAAHHMRLMKSAQRDGPYLIVGECTGGALAYEIASQLTRAGDSIALLALIDAFSPGLPRLRPAMPRPLYRLVHRARILAFHLGNLIRPGSTGKVGYVTSRLARSLGRLQSGARATVAQSGLSQPVAFRQALASYRPEPYDGEIVLFRASRLPLGIEPAPEMGWGALAREVEVETVPGYFTTPISEPGVRILAERLSRRLAGAAERH